MPAHWLAPADARRQQAECMPLLGRIMKLCQAARTLTEGKHLQLGLLAPQLCHDHLQLLFSISQLGPFGLYHLGNPVI